MIFTHHSLPRPQHRALRFVFIFLSWRRKSKEDCIYKRECKSKSITIPVRLMAYFAFLFLLPFCLWTNLRSWNEPREVSITGKERVCIKTWPYSWGLFVKHPPLLRLIFTWSWSPTWSQNLSETCRNIHPVFTFPTRQHNECTTQKSL